MGIEFTNGFTVTPINRSLYDFTTFTFTSVNINGPNPPSLAQFRGAYTGSATWASNSSYFTTQSGFSGYQLWTVPQNGTYEIEVAGASSGRINHSGVSGSIASGSKMRAQFSLQQNQKLLIVVGQHSANVTQVATYAALGGGGGTFVVPSGSNSGSINPLIVAGGGGGIGAWSSALPVVSGSQLFGRTTTSGGRAAFGELGGVSGSGGRSHVTSSLNLYDGGGGGGFAVGVSGSGMNGNGSYTTAASSNQGFGGKGFWTGSVGGGNSTTYPAPGTSPGGFGGGGGAGPITGGGGGGYSGGAGNGRNTNTAPDSGGGGGSYISSSATSVATADGNYETLSTFNGSAITTLGYHSGSGYVKITRL